MSDQNYDDLVEETIEEEADEIEDLENQPVHVIQDSPAKEQNYDDKIPGISPIK
jgi:hypothetical protein